jgi:hypothetical protein
MKTCKSCKYFAPSFLWRLFAASDFAKCSHPHNADLVTGDAGLYCRLAREICGNCEKSGKFWEAK